VALGIVAAINDFGHLCGSSGEVEAWSRLDTDDGPHFLNGDWYFHLTPRLSERTTGTEKQNGSEDEGSSGSHVKASSLRLKGPDGIKSHSWQMSMKKRDSPPGGIIEP